MTSRQRGAGAWLVAALLLGSPCVARAGTATFGPLDMQDLSGNPVSLRSLRGHPVLINFWATWCGACVGEMPILRKIASRHADSGLVVVAASLDEPESLPEVRRMAAQLGEQVRVWVGAEGSQLRALGIGDAVPVSVLLDADGKQLARHVGGLPDRNLDRRLEQLHEHRDAEPAPSPRRSPRQPKQPKQPKLRGALEAARRDQPDATSAGPVCVRTPS